MLFRKSITLSSFLKPSSCFFLSLLSPATIKSQNFWFPVLHLDNATGEADREYPRQPKAGVAGRGSRNPADERLIPRASAPPPSVTRSSDRLRRSCWFPGLSGSRNRPEPRHRCRRRRASPRAEPEAASNPAGPDPHTAPRAAISTWPVSGENAARARILDPLRSPPTPMTS